MKPILSRQEPRKARTAYPSKKNSNASSIIYKEITVQMQNLFEKNKIQKNIGSNSRPERKSKPEQQKYSLQNIKKKSSVINIPFQSQQQQPQLRENLMLNHNKGTISKDSQLEKKAFKYQYIIGKGGFGKVWRVEHVKNRNQYALKQMLKSLVMTKKSVQSVMNERALLANLCSPFIVNMHFAFQDRDTLYLVLDLMEGGDLRYHIGNKNFNEIQSKFFIACILLGLEYLHHNKIIHRDIKPENLVLDSRGYVRVTDLGIARTLKPNNSTDTSGTPGYMSPQVICRQNHTFVSDFFAVGVIAHQLMTGRRPYQGRSRAEIRDQMLAKQAQVKVSDIPHDWSYQAADFVNKLIQRKPQNRLGYTGIEQIKSHPWVRDLNWKKLLSKQIQSPFIPLMKKNNFDQDDQITIEDQQEAELIEKNSLLLRKPQFQELFKNYYLDGRKQKQSVRTTVKSNNFFNENNEHKERPPIKTTKNSLTENQIIRQKERQRQKISLKKPQTSLRGSKQHVVYKHNLETADTITKDNKKKPAYNGPYIQQRTFFKEFRL